MSNFYKSKIEEQRKLGGDYAKCRGCGDMLYGTPYYMGGDAYTKQGKRAAINHYGGYVCSRFCDEKSSADLENSMPGSSYGGNLSLIHI